MTTRDLVELVISKDNYVTKSNALIEAKYSSESATELKLIQTVFSNIQPLDKFTSTYVFPIKQFLDLLGLKGNSGYAELKKITFNLFKKPISITIDSVTTQLTWFSMVQYNDGKGTITIEINPFWEKYLIALTGRYTSYKLFNITNLKSMYSMRIYEILKSHAFRGRTRVISIKELREKLGIEDHQYPLYANLKQKIILLAQKELKEESDIYFEFSEIKVGRKVDSIEFQIFMNGSTSKPEEVITIDITSQGSELEKFGLSPQVVSDLIGKYPEERISANLEYTKKQMDVRKIVSPAAYLKLAIDNDYASSSKSIPRPASKQEEQLANLKVDNSKVDQERFEKRVDQVEHHLLEVKELKESFGTNIEDIKLELFKQLLEYQAYQERVHNKMVLPKEFKDPYVQGLCKEVIQHML